MNAASVTFHALDQVRVRRLMEPYQISRESLVAMWREGTIERWRDPDDPPGHVTVTSLGDAGALVGGLNKRTGAIAIISALTLQQYENNARCRWGEPK